DDKPVFQQEDHGASGDGLFTYDCRTMTEADHRQVRAAYYAMCELIDNQVGRMIAALDETGQRDNTIVVFMSDHGEMLGDHGLYLKGPHFYEQAIRVPLILSWPGRFAADRRVDGLVELVDLAPTLLEAAGLELPVGMQGRSLVRACEPESAGDVDRDSVFCEYYNAWTHGEAYATMLRTLAHKIVIYHGMEAGELYDLQADPDEFDNLWSRAEHADLRRVMAEACFDASIFTMDPAPPRRGPY
ncbi:MAG: sulfatase-like hydrolase/transferase, partial [Phycisphaerae bacterium]|nr:sulfatase-like hydrolase/transferase [Phycisphaerae bacterium]